jgi:hypothetical protein
LTLSLGQSFFTPPNAPGGRHLWVVVSDPAQSDKVAIVNLSTRLSRGADQLDPPCVIAASEHPALSKKSIVRCEHARLADGKVLEKAVNRRALSPTKFASETLVAKLHRALGASKQTPIEVKELLRGQGYLT